MGICATSHQEPIFEYTDSAQSEDTEQIIKYLKLEKKGAQNYFCNEIKKIFKTKPYPIKFVDEETLSQGQIKLQIYNLNGHLCIKRTGYNLLEVARFLRLFLIAEVGVKIVHVIKERFCKSGYTIFMEKLETREKLKYILLHQQQNSEDTYKQLNEIQNKLKQHKLAHCDIKFQNIGLKKGKGLFLIDCGDSRQFGKPRTVYTPVLNIPINHAQQIKSGQAFPLVDENTDYLGFENIKLQIHQWLEALEVDDKIYSKYAVKKYSQYEMDELLKTDFEKEIISLNYNEKITDGSLTGIKDFVE